MLAPKKLRATGTFTLQRVVTTQYGEPEGGTVPSGLSTHRKSVPGEPVPLTVGCVTKFPSVVCASAACCAARSPSVELLLLAAARAASRAAESSIMKPQVTTTRL